jgi:hypothetical protein
MACMASNRASITASKHSAIIAVVNLLIASAIIFSHNKSALRRQVAIDEIVVFEILPAEHAQHIIAVLLLATNVLFRVVNQFFGLIARTMLATVATN